MPFSLLSERKPDTVTDQWAPRVLAWSCFRARLLEVDADLPEHAGGAAALEHEGADMEQADAIYDSFMDRWSASALELLKCRVIAPISPLIVAAAGAVRPADDARFELATDGEHTRVKGFPYATGVLVLSWCYCTTERRFSRSRVCPALLPPDATLRHVRCPRSATAARMHRYEVSSLPSTPSTCSSDLASTTPSWGRPTEQ